MSKYKIVIEFDNEEVRDNFLGWYLDGGGNYQFQESCDIDCIKINGYYFDNDQEPWSIKISGQPIEENENE